MRMPLKDELKDAAEASRNRWRVAQMTEGGKEGAEKKQKTPLRRLKRRMDAVETPEMSKSREAEVTSCSRWR